jgi:hypothetical protein
VPIMLILHEYYLNFDSLFWHQKSKASRPRLAHNPIPCSHFPLSRYPFPLQLTTLSWRWKHQVPPKCWYLSSRVHGITSQKTIIWKPQTSQLQICLQLLHKISFASLKTSTGCQLKTSKLYIHGNRSQPLPRSYLSPCIMRVELRHVLFPNLEILSSVTK